MRTKFLRRGLATAALALLSALLPFQLAAQTGQRAPGSTAASTAFAVPVEASALATMRGGHELTQNDMRLDGVTAGNVASQVTTGANTISTGAFSGMAGLPLVVQNSGANVLIQNAVIVNVKMQ
ncbi:MULTISPECIES: hypothetical protein [unclassified Variovorax]|uniref:hypothetical protein n=1 Tax=unclassified Variovorax TaxID=663243 RepID=UPI002574BFC6|nr:MULTISPECIES: hypothetical protein [unclassified Variovorax]MDM0085934.1 hypothetical protein [Variovorax sp. J22G40]MDM0145809.1 hypothetical protein [Variovorax sp. J2P1-31]